MRKSKIKKKQNGHVTLEITISICLSKKNCFVKLSSRSENCWKISVELKKHDHVILCELSDKIALDV